jgi:hypothetical protein
MPSSTPATTIRFTVEDHEVLEELKSLTGLSSTSDIVRLALREMRGTLRAKLRIAQGRVRMGRR